MYEQYFHFFCKTHFEHRELLQEDAFTDKGLPPLNQLELLNKKYIGKKNTLLSNPYSKQRLLPLK